MAIDRGRKNNQLLIQPQYSPMPVGEQIAILYCGTHGLMRDIPIGRVRDFQEAFLTVLRAEHPDEVIGALAAGRITDGITDIIERTAARTASQFKA